MTSNPLSAPRAAWRTLAELTLPAAPEVAQQASAPPARARMAAAVATAVHSLGLPPARLAQLQAAVAEALSSNAGPGMAGHAIRLWVLVATGAEVADQGCTARGWGFFLIEASGESGQPEAGRGFELFLYREGAGLAEGGIGKA